MMMRTHCLGGIACGLVGASAWLPSPATSGRAALAVGVFVAASAAGSLLPDIDHRRSYIGQRFKATSFAASSLLGHRGFTHSALFVALLFGALWWAGGVPLTHSFSHISALGALIGVLSHLALDAATKGGIPLFYPLSRHRISIAPIKTGTLGETLVFWALGAAAAWQALSLFRFAVKSTFNALRG